MEVKVEKFEDVARDQLFKHWVSIQDFRAGRFGSSLKSIAFSQPRVTLICFLGDREAGIQALQAEANEHDYSHSGIYQPQVSPQKTKKGSQPHSTYKPPLSSPPGDSVPARHDDSPEIVQEFQPSKLLTDKERQKVQQQPVLP